MSTRNFSQINRQLKKWPAITLLVVALSIIIFSCNKMLQAGSDKFEVEEAKEYYYGTFKKSSQYLNATEQGKRLPDWKRGKVYKIGTMEFVELPLVQDKKHVSVPGNLSAEDKKRVISATVNRIAFIKLADGKIKARLIQYIPDIEYLRKSGFDISHNHFDNIDKDFKGTIEIKDWNQQPVEGLIMENGKVTKKIARRKAGNKEAETALNTTQLLNEGCGYQVTTDYVVECVYTYQGDVLISVECEEPEVVGVTVSEFGCDTPCMTDTDGADEQCVCQELNLCDGNNEEDIECNIDQNEAESLISDIYSSFETSSDIRLGIAGPEVTDAAGKKTRNVAPDWDFFFARLASVYKQTYTAFFVGGIGKENNNPWKWDSLRYVTQTQTSGANPPCMELEVNMMTTTINYINNRASAQIGMNWTARAVVKCAGDAKVGAAQYHQVEGELVASQYQNQ